MPELPRQYLDYIARGGTAVAFLTRDPGYMILWPVHEVPELNAGYGVVEFGPAGFLCFGSNGGGNLLAFDEAGAVHFFPAIGMKPVKRAADSWEEFTQFIETCMRPEPRRGASDSAQGNALGIDRAPSPKP